MQHEQEQCGVVVLPAAPIDENPFVGAAQTQANVNQQLKAEIAALANQLELIPGTGFMVGKRVDVLAKMRQLSAV